MFSKKILKKKFDFSFNEQFYCKDVLRNRMLNELSDEIVPVILFSDDLNSMMYSLENRSPFLDKKLVEFMFSIETKLLIKNGLQKFLLREVSKKLLPPTVSNSKKKVGFNASIHSLIDIKKNIDWLLAESRIFDIISRKKFEQILKSDFTRNDYSKFLFSFCFLKNFYRSEYKGKLMKKNKSAEPLVSVYIVNHNYGDYLDKAIESVLNQTLDDYEIIFIDNGSTDSSRKKIEKYYNNKKIKIILQKNIGLNAANNVALKLARGRYIIRLDADDFFDKNALEILVSKLEKDDNLGMVFSDYYTVDQKGDLIEMYRRHDFNEVELLDQPAHGACSMVRKEFLLAINGYDESYHCQDGWDLWVRFIRNFNISNVNLPLFYYRQHGKNLTKGKKKFYQLVLKF